MRGKPLLATLVFVACAGVSMTPARAVTDAERTILYAQFRTLFDAGQFQEALPLAEQLVAATEEQYGPDDRALANPLANLGTTQLRLNRFSAAEASYKRALAIVRSKSNASSTDRALLRPLQGLGVTYARTDQPGAAASTLKDAVDLSRNIDGLYNLEQLDYVYALIDAYIAGNQLTEAEREHLFAFRIAETAYGKDDARMLPAYDLLGRWYEYVGRYTTARVQHNRALRIAVQTSGRGSTATVEPLRGVARAFRLEYLYGREPSEQPVSNDPLQFSTGIHGGQMSTQLNPEGERALLMALGALDKADPPDPALLGETLLDLADWQLIDGNPRGAALAYRDAWQAMVRAGTTNLVSAPRQLRYRPPSASITRFKGGDVTEYEEFSIEARFTVKADGSTADVSTVPNDAPAELHETLNYAVRKALYAPRLVDGEAADTTGMSLTERVLRRKPKQAAGTTG
jgi:tetratricopeptide (TPR) repeat protein